MVRKSEGLSKRHQLILKFLADFDEKNGYSPSIREIGKSINVRSTSLVDYYLKQLEERDYISREQHISRSIRLLKPLAPSRLAAERITDGVRQAGSAIDDLLSIPVMGRIVASEPIPMPMTRRRGNQ